MNVLLVEDNPDYAGLVQQWLTAGEEAGNFNLIWTDTLNAGLNRVSQGGVDVILLDLGLPDSNGVETYTTTRSNAPGIPTIGLSAADNESLALQMIQEGAEDYLVKSTCNPERLIRAIRYAVVRRKSQGDQTSTTSVSKGRVLGVLGVKGGVGTTTVACYLAGELRRQTAEEVLLADLDSQAGTASFLMGIEPKYSMEDAIGSIARLDRSCWNGIVNRSQSDLDIISSPCLLGRGELETGGLRRVITQVGSFYKWIVVDLGRLSVFSTAVLDQVDELFVITTPSIHSLYQAKRTVDTFVANGMEMDALRLIVNQTEVTEALSGRELNSIFGIPVYSRLPKDSKQVHHACVQKRLPEPDSEIGVQMAKLARKVAGLAECQRKKGISDLFPFMERFRKSGETALAAQGD